MKNGFTLIELLVVVDIIGILASFGVVAYNGYIGSAKKAAAISNHKNVCKYVSAEAAKIEADFGEMFDGNITSGFIVDTYNDDGNPMGKITQAAVKALEGSLENPYGDGGIGVNAVTDSGWGKARDLGYTIIDPQGPHDGKIGVLHIHTCIELPCTGDYKIPGGLDYILYCPIDFYS